MDCRNTVPTWIGIGNVGFGHYTETKLIQMTSVYKKKPFVLIEHLYLMLWIVGVYMSSTF
jgi:hypothetical protein